MKLPLNSKFQQIGQNWISMLFHNCGYLRNGSINLNIEASFSSLLFFFQTHSLFECCTFCNFSFYSFRLQKLWINSVFTNRHKKFSKVLGILSLQYTSYKMIFCRSLFCTWLEHRRLWKRIYNKNNGKNLVPKQSIIGWTTAD